MGKLIIDNRSSITDAAALRLASQVVAMGRVSGNDGTDYCYATTFTNGVVVLSKLNKASDTLIITDGKEN